MIAGGPVPVEIGKPPRAVVHPSPCRRPRWNSTPIDTIEIGKKLLLSLFPSVRADGGVDNAVVHLCGTAGDAMDGRPGQPPLSENNHPAGKSIIDGDRKMNA